MHTCVGESVDDASLARWVPLYPGSHLDLKVTPVCLQHTHSNLICTTVFSHMDFRACTHFTSFWYRKAWAFNMCIMKYMKFSINCTHHNKENFRQNKHWMIKIMQMIQFWKCNSQNYTNEYEKVHIQCMWNCWKPCLLPWRRLLC